MGKTTTVSLVADKEYKQALKALASQRGVEVGQLVRDAIDHAFGDELKPYVALFHANTDGKNYQLKVEVIHE
jgi:hypothetical protein